LSCFIFIDPIYAENVNDDDEIFKNFKGMDKPYNGSLPWESNERFKEALVKLNNPKLMAAYKAVLSDPGEGEGYNIGLAAQKLAGTVVEPGQTYSQNNTIGPYTEYFGYRKGPSYAGNQMTTSVGGGVCKVASVLYNVVTFSDLPVIMRYSHSMTVPYVPPGQDATVHYGVKDLRFVNNTEGLVLIWSEKVGDALYIALYGFKEPPKVTWHHKIVKKHDYWTTTRYNPQLEPGEEKVVTQGKEGLIVKSWVTIETADGDITIKDKGKSWYNASPRIVEKGVKRTFSDYFSTLTSLIPGSR
jgi:vancomycin resistance protein YoaR